MNEYESMGTGELRKLIRERGIGSGLALSSASKAECVALLDGTITWAGFQARKATPAFSSPSGASTCQQSAGTGDAEGAMAQIAAGLAALMPTQKVDMEEVRKLAVDAGHDAAINAVTDVVKAELDSRLAPTRVVVEDRKLNVEKNVGVVHKRFPLLLAMCQARDKDGYVPPIYLYGPAGTGKTTTAKKIAEALGLDFHYNGAIGNAYELSGFIDAGGRFQETEFYKAYANGGVYLFDELDSSMPGAVLAFNAALANGHAAFPIGNVTRHRDCIILAAGNTCMRGDGNMSGFQRIKQDAAFRDRFTYLEWPIDEALEASMAAAYGDEWGWLDMVRRYRRNAERAGIKDFEVTPRAVDRGLAMLKAGIDLHDVVDMCVRKGLNADAWKKVEG